MSAPPSYAYLTAGDWAERIDRAETRARSCSLCPRACGVDRLSGETGHCGAGNELWVSSAFPHHGEEPPLSGTGGSGTVFFAHCTLGCVFCQNYQLSHEGEGRAYSVPELADRLLWLQREGCHNINLVTPTHFVPWVLRALCEAAGKGLSIPIVYNCGGYETVETLSLLRGIVDIYLPDMKYGEDGPAGRYSNVDDYVSTNRMAVREMFRQVGPMLVDKGGIATRGLCIRHLVLPEDQAHSEQILAWLVDTFDPEDLWISLMAQYRPCYRAREFPELDRRITAGEYEQIRTAFVEAGLAGYYQTVERMDDSFLINFAERKSQRLTGD
jgi:putative pyruvate formate lyase activating enzyme